MTGIAFLAFTAILAGWLILDTLKLTTLRVRIERLEHRRICDLQPCMDSTHAHPHLPFTAQGIALRAYANETPDVALHRSPIRGSTNLVDDTQAMAPVTIPEPEEYGTYRCNKRACDFRYIKYNCYGRPVWTRAIWNGHTSQDLLIWADLTEHYADCVRNLEMVRRG